MHPLHSLGWSASFENAMKPFASRGQQPARVVEEQRTEFRVATAASERAAHVAGKLRHEAQRPEDLPAVGDWVAIDAMDSTDEPPGAGSAVIRAVLPRRSVLVRKAADVRVLEAQVVAANVDVVFVVASLNLDLSLRRIERYLALVWESGAQPVVLLSKADLCPDAAARVDEVSAVSPGAPVHAVSALAADGGGGLEPLSRYLTVGTTAALVGSSGVGKSTLVNRLLGETRQAVKEIRDDDARGRHTTTARRLFLLPAGGMLVDTPGMREVGMWGGEDGVEDAFGDVSALGARCRFGDCRHATEPGCAVLAALADGSLPQERFDAYGKLLREIAFHARKDDPAAQAEQRRAWKIRARAARRRDAGR